MTHRYLHWYPLKGHPRRGSIVTPLGGHSVQDRGRIEFPHAAAGHSGTPRSCAERPLSGPSGYHRSSNEGPPTRGGEVPACAPPWCCRASKRSGSDPLDRHKPTDHKAVTASGTTLVCCLAMEAWSGSLPLWRRPTYPRYLPSVLLLSITK